MDGLHVVILVLGILAAQGIVWGLIFRRLRGQSAALKSALELAGENILIGPMVGLYQKAGVVSVRTTGAIALTDRRIVFRKPFGGEIDLPLSRIVGISENPWFQGNYRSGRMFLILKLADGTEVAFQVKNHDEWVRELRSRTSAA